MTTNNAAASAIFSTIRVYGGTQALVEFSGGGDDGAVDHSTWTVLRDVRIKESELSDTISNTISELGQAAASIKKYQECDQFLQNIINNVRFSTEYLKKNGALSLVDSFLYDRCIPVSFDGAGDVWGCILFDALEMKVHTSYKYQELVTKTGDAYSLEFDEFKTPRLPENFLD